MANKLEQVFEDGQEVYEMTQTQGYEIIQRSINERLTYNDQEIKHLIDNVKGNTNPQTFTQELIRLQSYREGLLFIINQVQVSIDKRDKANKKLK